MKARDVEEQIRALTRDLEPVRPIPRIRGVLAAALLFALALALIHGLSGGPGLRPAGAAVSGFPYLGQLFGLVVMALGGLGASLAAAVPGREATGRIATRVALSGLALVLAAAVFGIATEGDGGFRVDECLTCTVHSCLLALGPIVVALGFLWTGVIAPLTRATATAAAMALVGSVAAGSALVHLMCAKDAPIHWLLGHAVFAVAIAIALTAPVAVLLRWRMRRPSEAIR